MGGRSVVGGCPRLSTLALAVGYHGVGYWKGGLRSGEMAMIRGEVASSNGKRGIGEKYNVHATRMLRTLFQKEQVL